jgi:hypothetical protein
VLTSSLLTLLLFGCLTGVTTVLFGFGGGFITVPVVYGVLTVAAHPGAGDAMHVAVATSAAVMVVNASVAALAQWRQDRLRPEYLWPLAGFITVGAAAGSFAATLIGGTALRLLFAAYLLVTITDSLVRKGFLTVAAHRTRPRPLDRGTATFGGIGIGLVAAGLGVGGSVMTVPLLRRRGLRMAEATAMANPLTIPVALAGTLVYALAPSPAGPAASGRLGYVDLTATAALLAGSLPTIAVVRRLTPHVPDRVHSVAYVALLLTVLVVMLATGL